MERNHLREKIEYIVAIVSEIARRCRLSEPQAFRYIKFHKGVNFIEEHYGILHTLDLDEALENVLLLCKRNGGKL